MSGSIPYLGSKISLISKSEIRYEGILYTIDAQESIIALAKVRSFGTEDRPTEMPVPARDEVYEYIIFRGTDIKTIEICDTPKVQSALHNDPAIVQHSAPSVTGTIGQPPVGPTSVGGSSFGQSSFQSRQSLGPIGGGIGSGLSSFSGGSNAGGQFGAPSIQPSSIMQPGFLGGSGQQNILADVLSGSRSSTPGPMPVRKSPVSDVHLSPTLIQPQRQPVQPQQERKPMPQRQQNDRGFGSNMRENNMREGGEPGGYRQPQRENQRGRGGQNYRGDNREFNHQHQHREARGEMHHENNREMHRGGGGGGGGGDLRENNRGGFNREYNNQRNDQRNDYDRRQQDYQNRNDNREYYRENVRGEGRGYHGENNRGGYEGGNRGGYEGGNRGGYGENRGGYHEGGGNRGGYVEGQRERYQRENQGYNQGRDYYQGGYNQGGFYQRGMNQVGGRGMRPGRRPSRGGRGMFQGASRGGKQDMTQYATEFDFEQANEEFEELRTHMSKVKIGDKTSENGETVVADKQLQANENDPTHSEENNHFQEGEGEKGEEGGEDSEDSGVDACYDKTKSFFDSISCEAIERSKGRSQRPDWRLERKTNVQTFGVATSRRGYYPRNRGGYYQNRGGYYRNNYGNQGNQGGFYQNRGGGGNYRGGNRGGQNDNAGGERKSSNAGQATNGAATTSSSTATPGTSSYASAVRSAVPTPAAN